MRMHDAISHISRLFDRCAATPQSFLGNKGGARACQRAHSQRHFVGFAYGGRNRYNGAVRSNVGAQGEAQIPGKLEILCRPPSLATIRPRKPDKPRSAKPKTR